MTAYKPHEGKCPTELSSIMQGLKGQLANMSTSGFTSFVRGGTPYQIITLLHTYIYIDQFRSQYTPIQFTRDELKCLQWEFGSESDRGFRREKGFYVDLFFSLIIIFSLILNDVCYIDKFTSFSPENVYPPKIPCI